MYTGKFIFTQLMDHLPWHTFHHCVRRYNGNHKVKSFRCAEQYRCMAFAQLTYQESLRDIEISLRVHSSELYHIGIPSGVSRNTLAIAIRRKGEPLEGSQTLRHQGARRLHEVLAQPGED